MALTKATKEPGIQFIEGIKGSYYRVQIRLKGRPHLSKTLIRLKKPRNGRETVAALQSRFPL
jgi:hypothetical protein